MHHLYFIYARKIYERAHVKITRQWKSLTMPSYFLDKDANEVVKTFYGSQVILDNKAYTSIFHHGLLSLLAPLLR